MKYTTVKDKQQQNTNYCFNLFCLCRYNWDLWDHLRLIPSLVHLFHVPVRFSLPSNCHIVTENLSKFYIWQSVFSSTNNYTWQEQEMETHWKRDVCPDLKSKIKWHQREELHFFIILCLWRTPLIIWKLLITTTNPEKTPMQNKTMRNSVRSASAGSDSCSSSFLLLTVFCQPRSLSCILALRQKQ